MAITTSRAGNEAIAAVPIRQSHPSGLTTGSIHRVHRRGIYAESPRSRTRNSQVTHQELRGQLLTQDTVKVLTHMVTHG